MPERSNNQAILDSSSAPRTAQAAPEPSERRVAVRYPFTATAEVVDLTSQACASGRSSDLGPGGCYVDTISPLPVGARVRVRLEQGQRQFEAIATVAYGHQSLGMGLVFTKIDPGAAKVLQMWIAELSGAQLPELMTESQEESQVEKAKQIDASDMREAVSELIRVLVRRKLIPDYEGAALLNKIPR